MSSYSKLQRLPVHNVRTIASLLEPQCPGLRSLRSDLVEGIKASVRRYGLLDFPPFHVKVDQYGRILGGRHRIAAAKELNVRWPATITTVEDDSEAIVIAYLDNAHYGDAADIPRLDDLLDVWIERASMLVAEIYVIGSEHGPWVKVGITHDLPGRLCSIQRMSAVPVKILWHTYGSRESESQLHVALADHRAWGEWFDLGPDPVQVVKDTLGRLFEPRQRPFPSPVLPV